MAATSTRADSLQLRDVTTDTEVVNLTAVGAVRGTVVTFASGANGPGGGRLKAEGPLVSWRPPGAADYGPAVDVSAGGAYLLEGPDPAKYVRLTATAGWLPPGAETARVLLADRYDNYIGIGDNIDHALHIRPVEVKRQLQLKNIGPQVLRDVRVWLDATAATYWVTISLTDSGYTAPTDEDAALMVGDLVPGGTQPLWVRHNVAPSTAGANPKLLNLVHARFDGLI